MSRLHSNKVVTTSQYEILPVHIESKQRELPISIAGWNEWNLLLWIELCMKCSNKDVKDAEMVCLLCDGSFLEYKLVPLLHIF